MPAGRRPGPTSGFTLLEILVALGVLGLLMVGLTQGVRAGLTLWNAQSRRINSTANLDAAARTLRTLLSSIPMSPGTPGAAIQFDGHPDHVILVGNLPTGLGTTQRADIDLKLRGRQLILSWRPHRHANSDAPPPKPIETELIGGVERFRLAYWGEAQPDQPPGWQARWPGPQLPSLIRVTIAFAKGDPRHWPDLIASSRP